MSLRAGKRIKRERDAQIGNAKGKGKYSRALVQSESRIPQSIWRLPLSGFPPARTVRLRYVEEISLNSPTAGVAYHMFSANGMYDPNVTGTGHQPRGFDQNMVMYDHYTVTDSKITILPASNTTVNLDPCYYDVHCQDSVAATVTSYIDLFEKRQASGMLQTAGLITGRNPQPITRYFNTAKFFNKTAKALPNSDLSGTASSQPAEQAYWAVYAASVGGNDPVVFNFLVQIDYVAVLTEMKSINAS